MGLFSRRPRTTDVHIGDATYDEWEPVGDYEDLKTAKAFAGHLTSLGITCALTSDWPLDRFGQGDIALRVPPDAIRRRDGRDGRPGPGLGPEPTGHQRRPRLGEYRSAVMA